VKIPFAARIGCLVLIVVVVATTALFHAHPGWLFYRHEFKVGNEIIAKVEAFRARHGRLPETLRDVGINDPDLNVHYDKIDENEYRVWFGISSVGESEVYDSRTKKWD
jgi:hypothetical protein